MCENGWEVPPRNKWGCAVWLLRKSILNDMDKNILKLYLEFCEFKRSMTPYCEVHQQFPPFHFYNGTLNLSFPAYKLRKIASWLEAVPIVTDLIRTSWILMVWINNEKSGYFDLTWVTYTLSAYKCHKGNSKKVISKKFRKWFHSCTCILPDYVSDESAKEFWKNSHFENLRAGFLGRW